MSVSCTCSSVKPRIVTLLIVINVNRSSMKTLRSFEVS
jgi:hypothetical protein